MTIDGLTQASSVIALLRRRSAASSTVTQSLMPSKRSAPPLRPVGVQVASRIVPVWPLPVTSVTVVDENLKAARVVVPDYQLSLAIGREGQNARLAARLTGWRIDIRSDTAPS